MPYLVVCCGSYGIPTGYVGPFKTKKLAEAYVKKLEAKNPHNYVDVGVHELLAPRSEAARWAIEGSTREPSLGRD